jgi:hypothetical protein
MEVFCLEDFKKEVEKLSKNNSYGTLEPELIAYFFNKTIDELRNGTILNNSLENAFIKKRLEGSGGFRVYYYLIIRKGCLYLMYVHPKTGKYGCDNISPKEKKDLLKKVIEAITTNNLYLVTPDRTNTKLIFKERQ